MVTPIHGWAVEDKTGILIRTVSDTRRAAIVNWLVTERRVMVFANYTDDLIERLWWEHKREADEVVVIEVRKRAT